MKLTKTALKELQLDDMQVDLIYRISKREETQLIDTLCVNWLRQCFNRPSDHVLRMHAIDCILDTHGVEHFEHRNKSYLYCNTGDSYALTIMYCIDTGKFTLNSLGNIVE